MRYFFVLILLFVFAFNSVAFASLKPRAAADLAAALNQFLDQAEAFGFSGSVLIAVDGKVLVNKGYGLANREKNIAVKANDVFDIGSITKQFTAAAIMKLEMLGKLKTEDLISKYLEGVPADKAQITLHQTLTHTAGFINYSGGDYEVSERDETIKRILAAPLTHKPGTEMRYSNSGYSILAAIVENVSGESYESFLSEQIFKPAGMMNTGYVLPKFDKATLPHAYENDIDLGTALDYKWSPTGPYWNLFGNGGTFSTTGDMYKWYQALQGEKVLSAAAKKKLFTPFLNNYAYGWDVSQTPQGLLITHNGASDNGFNGTVGFYPEKKIFGVVLSNGSRYLDLQIYSDVIMNRIGKIMAGEEFKPLASLNFVKLQPVAYSNIGTYRLENGDEFRITLREGGLLLEPFGQSAAMALGQFPKANPGQLSAINEKAKPVIEGILKKDYTAFKSNIADGATFDRLKGVLEQRISEWEKSDGPIKLLTVAGTVPAWWTDEQMPTTFVNVQMEKRSRLFRLNWKEGKITNIGGAGIPAPILIQMLPTSQTDFLGWQIVTSRPNAVRFSPDGKTVSVTADGRTTIAKKVE